MAKGLLIIIILVVIAFLALQQGYIKLEDFFPKVQETQPPIAENTTYVPKVNLQIASWNLENFGTTKAFNSDLLMSMAVIIDDYDIIAVQEITDYSEKAFPKLCDLLKNNFDCVSSARTGTSTQKEQYGFIYRRTKVNLTGTTDLASQQERWERPPFIGRFQLNSWSFSLVNFHSKPDNTPKEIRELDELTRLMPGEIIVIGDLNADCTYYQTPPADFKNWTWAIPDSADTTVHDTDCAYDRIIFNSLVSDNYITYGIRDDIKPEQSDHKLIWASFE